MRIATTIRKISIAEVVPAILSIIVIALHLLAGGWFVLQVALGFERLWKVYRFAVLIGASLLICMLIWYFFVYEKNDAQTSEIHSGASTYLADSIVLSKITE